MRYFSTRIKLILVLCFILISGFLLTNVISYRASKESVRSTIINASLPLARDNIYSEIQKDLTRPIFVSSLMAHDTFLKDWVLNGEKDPAEIQKYLGEIQKKYHFFSSFFVSDKTLNYYHFKGIIKQISPQDSHDVWYYGFKALDRQYALDVDTDQASHNNLTIFINHRLHGYDGEFLGVVGVGLNINKAARLLEFYKDKYQRSVFMTDDRGIIQVHTDQSKVETLSIQEIPGISNLTQEILAAQDEPAFFEYDANGRHILLTTRYIKELNWYLLVEQDQTLALKSIHDTFIQNFVIGLVITLITAIFAIMVINHYQGQLEKSATRDKLTNAFNRREFERRFHYHSVANRRRHRDMCILLFDIDHLKTINDTHGHLFGDHVIQATAQIAQTCIREHDLLVRWGGDEFVILLFSTADQAERIAQRMLTAVAQYDFAKGFRGITSPCPVTISCGQARLKPEESLDEVLVRADKALYEAKAFGRNKIISTEKKG